MAHPDYEARLTEAKRQSTLQLLFRAARLLNEQALQQVRQREPYQGVRAAHTQLLPHIDLVGTRATVLAQRVGISKQAVGQLLDDLQQADMIERVPDPSDGRAKLVRFTVRGRQALIEGLGVLMDVEAELAVKLGEARMEALHDVLVDLVELAEAGTGGVEPAP